jgi:hypothetical protein
LVAAVVEQQPQVCRPEGMVDLAVVHKVLESQQEVETPHQQHHLKVTMEEQVMIMPPLEVVAQGLADHQHQLPAGPQAGRVFKAHHLLHHLVEQVRVEPLLLVIFLAVVGVVERLAAVQGVMVAVEQEEPTQAMERLEELILAVVVAVAVTTGLLVVTAQQAAPVSSS